MKPNPAKTASKKAAPKKAAPPAKKPAAKQQPKPQPHPPAPEEKKLVAPEPAGPITVKFTDLAKFLDEHPPTDKWYTFVDTTKGNVSTFFKYTGNVIYAYVKEDMTDQKLDAQMRSVVMKGVRLFIDFQDIKVDFESYIHAGAFPAELFDPKEIHSEKLNKAYQKPDEELPVNQKGEIAFIFTDDAAVPDWAKAKTVLVHVNP